MIETVQNILSNSLFGDSTESHFSGKKAWVLCPITLQEWQKPYLTHVVQAIEDGSGIKYLKEVLSKKVGEKVEFDFSFSYSGPSNLFIKVDFVFAASFLKDIKSTIKENFTYMSGKSDRNLQNYRVSGSSLTLDTIFKICDFVHGGNREKTSLALLAFFKTLKDDADDDVEFRFFWDDCFTFKVTSEVGDYGLRNYFYLWLAETNNGREIRLDRINRSKKEAEDRLWNTLKASSVFKPLVPHHNEEPNADAVKVEPNADAAAVKLELTEPNTDETTRSKRKASHEDPDSSSAAKKPKL